MYSSQSIKIYLKSMYAVTVVSPVFSLQWRNSAETRNVTRRKAALPAQPEAQPQGTVQTTRCSSEIPVGHTEARTLGVLSPLCVAGRTVAALDPGHLRDC